MLRVCLVQRHREGDGMVNSMKVRPLTELDAESRQVRSVPQRGIALFVPSNVQHVRPGNHELQALERSLSLDAAEYARRRRKLIAPVAYHRLCKQRRAELAGA